MYKDDEFYIITDLMHFNVYRKLLEESVKNEERVIIKVFKKDNEVVIMETNNFQDTIIKDTRKDKNDDLMTYDLTFLKVLERYESDYEIKEMKYEYVDGVGSWCRVKIDGYKPDDKLLKPFYLKKKITKEDLKNYASNKEELKRLEKFFDITKGLLKFSKIKDVKEMFDKVEN